MQQPINLNSTKKNPLAHEETSHTNEEDILSYFSLLMLVKIPNMQKQLSSAAQPKFPEQKIKIKIMNILKEKIMR